MSHKRKPKNIPLSNLKKQAKNSLNPDSYMNMNISWHLRSIELTENSDWTWHEVFEIRVNNNVFNKLSEYETMNLSQVQNKTNHAIPLDNLSKKAKAELGKKRQDDIECLHSFHINGGTRFYCIPNGNIMKLLWYDPYHSDPKKAVCPSYKKHT